MTGYSVEIKETSRELTAKQRIALKDTSDAPQYIKTIWGVGYKI